ncbi:MAG: hypothetical protein HZA50_11685 [Planctomycetes bacterium]|nr:hypothetical protein [Planctomycetota bacterium]
MTSDCGNKHLKLAAWIVATVLTACTAVTFISVKCYSAGVEDLAARVRQSEQIQAGQTVKLDSIQRSQERVEGKLDRLIEKDRKP